MITLFYVSVAYHRTFKQNCPAGIKLGLTEDCQSLIVTDNNHVTGKVNA